MRKKNGKLNTIAVLESAFVPTPVQALSGDYSENRIYVKRDDLIPFSFGGNKVRKAQCFYADIMKEQPDILVTYGSNSSNHCRVISNMAASMGIPCHVISSDHNVEGKDGRELFNRELVEQSGADVETVPVSMVHDTIEARLEDYRRQGMQPYFIPGGGHGDIGTDAYTKAYVNEFLAQMNALQIDYLFLASGTGATQAGLICGKTFMSTQLRQLNLAAQFRADGNHKTIDADPDKPVIVGISIARKEERGREVVKQSVLSYLEHCMHGRQSWFREEDLIFDDHYILGGYGLYNAQVLDTIEKVFRCDGIPMDTTYTGKAFTGMLNYLTDHGIRGKNIMFLHTGGAPLFFDRL